MPEAIDQILVRVANVDDLFDGTQASSQMFNVRVFACDYYR